MVEGQDDNVEEALWLALNTLEESEQLYTRLAQQAQERNHAWMGDRFSKKAQTVRERASAIRGLLTAEPREARKSEEREQEAKEDAAEGEAGD